MKVPPFFFKLLFVVLRVSGGFWYGLFLTLPKYSHCLQLRSVLLSLFYVVHSIISGPG